MAEHSEWTISKVLPSKADAAEELVTETLNQLQRRGWEEADVFSVRLALVEAFNNATEHGNQRDENKQVTIECRVDGDRFWASVCDEGEGFDPNSVPDCRDEENLLKPRGRGLFLMRNYMDQVEYNDVGNCITLQKTASGE